MAASEFKTGTFNKSTSTSTPVTQAITGVGFTPKALILFASYTTAEDSSTADFQFALGASDGTTEKCGVANCDDSRGTSDSRRRSNDTKILMLRAASSDTLLAECDLTSFDADGFTLSWTTNNAVAVKIKYIALGGSNLTADVFEFAGRTTNGTQNVATALNTADFVFLFGVTATSHNTTNDFGFFNLGMSTGPSNEGCINSLTGDNIDTQNSSRSQKTSAIIHVQNSITNSIQVADFTNFTSSGFDLNWTDTNGTAYLYMGLTIKGGEWEVGNGTTNTSAANKSYTTSFKPVGVMAMSFGAVASSNPGENHGFVMFGGSSGAADDQGVVASDEDNVITTDSYMQSSATHMLHIINPTDGTTLDRAQLDSFNATDFTMDFGTADGTAREFIWAVLKEDAGVGGGSIPIFMHHYKQMMGAN